MTECNSTMPMVQYQVLVVHRPAMIPGTSGKLFTIAIFRQFLVSWFETNNRIFSLIVAILISSLSVE